MPVPSALLPGYPAAGAGAEPEDENGLVDAEEEAHDHVQV